jgi:hypothetical protein
MPWLNRIVSQTVGENTYLRFVKEHEPSAAPTEGVCPRAACAVAMRVCPRVACAVAMRVCPRVACAVSMRVCPCVACAAAMRVCPRVACAVVVAVYHILYFRNAVHAFPAHLESQRLVLLWQPESYFQRSSNPIQLGLCIHRVVLPWVD